MIEADVEALEVPGAVGRDARDERLRTDSLLFRLEHDRCPVRVVRADEKDLVALHALEAHPDIGLDVLHDVPDVERAVGVGQSGSDEEFAGHPDSLPPSRR